MSQGPGVATVERLRQQRCGKGEMVLGVGRQCEHVEEVSGFVHNTSRGSTLAGVCSPSGR